MAVDVATEVIDQSDQIMGDEGCETLCQSIMTNNSALDALKSLNLRGNHLGVSGIRELANLIRASNSLEILHLEWNDIGRSLDAVRDLFHAIGHSSSLVEVYLCNNRFSPSTGLCIADCLFRNTSLRKLDLSWGNNLGVEGGRCIAGAIEGENKNRNHTIQEIGLQGNCITQEILSQIESSLQINRGASSRTVASINTSSVLSSSAMMPSPKNSPTTRAGVVDDTLSSRDISRYVKQQERMEQEIEKKDKWIQNLKDEIEEKEEQFRKERSDMLFKRDGNHRQMIQDLQEAKDQADEYKAKADDLHAQLDAQKLQIAKLKEEILQYTGETLSDKIKDLEAELVRQKRLYEDMRQSKETDKDEIQKKLSEMEVKFEKEREYFEAEKKKVASLEVRLEEKEKELQRHVDDAEAAASKNHEVHSRAEFAEQRLKTAEDLRQKAQEEAKAARQTVLQVRMQGEENVIAVENRMRKQQEQMHKDFQDRLDSLQAARDSDLTQMEKMRKDLEASQRKHADIVATLERKLQTEKAKRIEVEKEKTDFECETQALKNDLVSATQSIEIEQNKLKRTQEQLQDQHKEQAIRVKELEEKRANEREDLRKELEVMRNQKEELSIEMQNLRSEMSRKEDAHTRMKNEMKDALMKNIHRIFDGPNTA